jgi:hypothetical protein
MPHVKRIVIGVKDDKKSAVIFRDSPNHQESRESFGGRHGPQRNSR